MIPPLIEPLLKRYEVFFTQINMGTFPIRSYPGSEELIAEYAAILNPTEADQFFEKFGVGNSTDGTHKPFDRQVAYIFLLEILEAYDAAQYHAIHKGTPFYFIGWTAYQYFNFNRAMFYMDAAVSEDLKFPQVQAKQSSRASLNFFLLKPEPGPSGLPIHLELIDVVEEVLKDYHTDGGGVISVDDFRIKFAEDLLYAGPKQRSVLTALYTFILQYEDCERSIRLRSNTGGSIQPFLDHLFDGARMLESLLEERGGGGKTLHPKITSTPALSVNQNVLSGNKTLNEAEQAYQNHIASGSSFQDRNFSSSYIVRNTTGHSLLWPDQFASISSYKTLYSSLINSIFWTIEKLWL
ncbi:MAG: hypothetical protein WCF67_17445 [Chitinophagaceae bacterium]